MNLGQNDPLNDPGDPLVGVLKIHKPIHTNSGVSILRGKLIKSVWSLIWGDQGGHFCKNHVFYHFPIHLYREYSQKQTKQFLTQRRTELRAKNWHATPQCHLESFPKGALKRDL